MSKIINLEDHMELLNTIEGINEFGNLIANKYWDMDLDVPIVINKRLIKTYGRFMYRYIRNKKGKILRIEPHSIEISNRVMENFIGYSKLQLLKHEICHWACVKLGNSHGDGSKFFESELRRIGAVGSGTSLL